MFESLFSTVTALAQAGFIGVGVIVFLLLFILLMKGKPVDPATSKLYNRFLTWGVSFAAFCGVLAFATLLVPPEKPAAPTSPQPLRVFFVPDFDSAKLPAPKINLYDGTTTAADKPFVPQNGVINVNVQAALDQIGALTKASSQLTESNAALRQQRDKLASVLSPSAATPAETATLKAASADAARLEATVSSAIAAGDFKRAADASEMLAIPSRKSSIAIEKLVRPSVLLQPPSR